MTCHPDVEYVRKEAMFFLRIAICSLTGEKNRIPKRDTLTRSECRLTNRNHSARRRLVTSSLIMSKFNRWMIASWTNKPTRNIRVQRNLFWNLSYSLQEYYAWNLLTVGKYFVSSAFSILEILRSKIYCSLKWHEYHSNHKAIQIILKLVRLFLWADLRQLLLLMYRLH